MRKLKFKGIHPHTKTTMDVCVIDWMHDEVYFEQGADVSYGIEECKLKQFTGIKTNKGEDIFEGDTVYIAGVGDCEVAFDCCGYWAFGRDRVDYQDVIEDIEYIVKSI